MNDSQQAYRTAIVTVRSPDWNSVWKLCEVWFAILVSFVILAYGWRFDVNVSAPKAILGFILITIMPGWSILFLLDKDNCERRAAVQLCYAVGISIMLQMLLMPATSLILSALGVIQSLTSQIIIAEVLSLNALLATLTTAFRRNESIVSYCASNRGTMSMAHIALPLSVPLLASAGAMASVGDIGDSIQLATIIAIIALFVGPILSDRIRGNVLCLWIFCASLGILFLSPLESSHMFATDMAAEYEAFSLVNRTQRWDITSTGSALNAVLSVSVLPLSYHHLMGVDGELVFKTVLPTIMGFLPLSLFLVFRSTFGDRTSVASVFFFVSFSAFLTISVSHARIGIAELFVALILIQAFTDSRRSKHLSGFLTIAFTASLVVSYYGLASLFVGSIAVGAVIMNWREKRRCEYPAVMRPLVLAISAALFIGWYMFTAKGYIFTNVVWIGQDVYDNLIWGFAADEARDPIMRMMLGFGGPPTLLYAVMIWAYRITQGIVALGASVFVWRVLIRNNGGLRTSEYACFVLVAVLFLGVAVVQPFFVKMGVTRLYQITLVFLSPMLVVGLTTILYYLRRSRPLRMLAFKKASTNWLCVAVLVPYFLLSSGFAAEVADDHPISFSLSGDRMTSSDDWLTRVRGVSFQIRTGEIDNARWLSTFRDEDRTIYSDDISAGTVLSPYGNMRFGKDVMSVQYHGELDGYLYLRYVTAHDDIFLQRNVTKSFLEWQIPSDSAVDLYLSSANLISDNGISIVYFGSPIKTDT